MKYVKEDFRGSSVYKITLSKYDDRNFYNKLLRRYELDKFKYKNYLLITDKDKELAIIQKSLSTESLIRQNDDIKYNENVNEFELQANLYYNLKELGYKVQGEVYSKSGKHDLVIFDNNLSPILIIELKKNTPSIKTRQIKRYNRLSIPLLLANGRRHNTIIEYVKDANYKQFHIIA